MNNELLNELLEMLKSSKKEYKALLEEFNKLKSNRASKEELLNKASEIEKVTTHFNDVKKDYYSVKNSLDKISELEHKAYSELDNEEKKVTFEKLSEEYVILNYLEYHLRVKYGMIEPYDEAQEACDRINRKKVVAKKGIITAVAVLGILGGLSFANRSANTQKKVVPTPAPAIESVEVKSSDNSKIEVTPTLMSNPQSEKFSEEYRYVSSENVFVYKSMDEIIDILENGTGVVYLGFPKCPWCQRYVEVLNEVAMEKGIDEISYYNIYEDRKENSEDYRKIVSLLDSHLLTDENGNKRVFVPDLTFVKDGEIIFHDNETSIAPEGYSPSEYWNEENTNNFKNKIESYFDIYMNKGMSR